jgi:hypothetical protein
MGMWAVEPFILREIWGRLAPQIDWEVLADELLFHALPVLSVPADRIRDEIYLC